MKIKRQTKAENNLHTLILSTIFISLALFSCPYLFAQETATDVSIDDFHIKNTALPTAQKEKRESPPAVKKSASRLSLGIKARNLISKERKEAFLPESGLIVTHVTNDSPADNAGLQKDDIILFENNNLVQGTQSLRQSMKKISAGEDIILTVINGNSVKEVCLSPEDFNSSKKDISLGIKVKKNTASSNSSFSSLGLLVTSVKKDTPASQSGIAKGDIILFIDEKPVTSLTDVRNCLSRKKPGDNLMVSVLREKTRSDFMIFFELKKEKSTKIKKSKLVVSEKDEVANTLKPDTFPAMHKSAEKENVSEKAAPLKRLPSIHVGAN